LLAFVLAQTRLLAAIGAISLFKGRAVPVRTRRLDMGCGKAARVAGVLSPEHCRGMPVLPR
jgi:hypothetical protein